MRNVLWTLCCLFMVGLFAGCDSADDTDVSSFLRVIHADPDVEALNFFINDDEAFSSIAFGTVSDYLEFEETILAVIIRSAENADADSIAGTTQLRDGAYHSLAVLGDTTPVVLLDSGAEPEEDEVALRLIHAAADVGVVDIYVTDPDEDIETLEPNFAGIEFTEPTAVVGATPDTYQVRITPANEKTILFDDVLTLEGGTTYTVFATGTDEDDDAPFALLVAER